MPMLPPDVALADAIAEALNLGWVGDFTAERVWAPDWETRTEMDSLQVAVQPSPQPSGARWERTDSPRETWPINVGFAKRLSLRTRTEIDDLLSLVDAVREYLQFATFTLPAPDNRVFEAQGFEFLVRYEPELIRRQKVGDSVIYAGSFLSVVQFPFVLLT